MDPTQTLRAYACLIPLSTYSLEASNPSFHLHHNHYGSLHFISVSRLINVFQIFCPPEKFLKANPHNARISNSSHTQWINILFQFNDALVTHAHGASNVVWKIYNNKINPNSTQAIPSN